MAFTNKTVDALEELAEAIQTGSGYKSYRLKKKLSVRITSFASARDSFLERLVEAQTKWPTAIGSKSGLKKSKRHGMVKRTNKFRSSTSTHRNGRSDEINNFGDDNYFR